MSILGDAWKWGEGILGAAVLGPRVADQIGKKSDDLKNVIETIRDKVAEVTKKPTSSVDPEV